MDYVTSHVSWRQFSPFVAARVEDNARYGCGVSEQISTGLATLHVQRKWYPVT